ncbi:MAG: HAD-IIB family hydrolase [Patescibacteria group bacterium]
MKQVLAFDLDDTLAITKSPISDEMVEVLSKILEKFDVCVISGGRFEQFQLQIIDRLHVNPHILNRLHLMPTCGTRYYRYDELASEWKQQYAEDLTEDQKKQITEVLEASARELGLWEENPAGEIIEDRGSQITYSALGQKATAEDKYAWDPESTKKFALRDLAAESLLGLEVRAGGTTSIDVTREGIDKAYGMQKLIEALDISKDDILFFGDKLQEGGNDYPVRAMGIDCLDVDKWEDTVNRLETILAVIHD